MFESTGIIIYDPPRADMRKRVTWWCVINIDREITRYFRWWVQRALHIELCQPSWDAHISIVRGEEPADKSLWRKYHGKAVTFRYSPDVKRSGGPNRLDRPEHFWYVEVDCPEINRIRQEFGLYPGFTYHLTVGRTY